jgi:hypothetical protein
MCQHVLLCGGWAPASGMGRCASCRALCAAARPGLLRLLEVLATHELEAWRPVVSMCTPLATWVATSADPATRQASFRCGALVLRPMRPCIDCDASMKIPAILRLAWSTKGRSLLRTETGTWVCSAEVAAQELRRLPAQGLRGVLLTLLRCPFAGRRVFCSNRCWMRRRGYQPPAVTSKRLPRRFARMPKQ